MYPTFKYSNPTNSIVAKAWEGPQRKEFIHLFVRLIHFMIIKCHALFPYNSFDHSILLNRSARDSSEETKDTQARNDLEEMEDFARRISRDQDAAVYASHRA